MNHADFAVIGGGLLGCGIAYYLSTHGLKGVLFEKDQINQNASGRNAGSLHFQLEYRMIADGDVGGQRAAERIPLHLNAQKMWENLSAELDASLGFVMSGGLMLAETPEQARLLERKTELERSHGLPVEIIERPALDDIAPYLSPDVIAASYCRLEGKANPRVVAPAYARAGARLGLQVYSGARVTGLQRSRGGWRISCLDGSRFQADVVIIASGAWTGLVAQLVDVRLPVLPMPLSMTVTSRMPKIVGHLVQHAGARLSFKQTAEGNLLIGGGWPSKLHHHHGALSLDQAPDVRLDSMIGSAAVASRVVPSIADALVLRTWTGLTAMTADHLPMLGPVPKRPGLYVATGGSAFTVGPTYAQLMSQIVTGSSLTLDVSPFSLDRFGYLNYV